MDRAVAVEVGQRLHRDKAEHPERREARAEADEEEGGEEELGRGAEDNHRPMPQAEGRCVIARRLHRVLHDEGL